jgi:coenzyme F420-reducing hydrogenase alpha subunit
LSRVEGRGNIEIRIKDGKVVAARWDVVETPRFFEAMLVGKLWENAPWITGRICGICSIGHTLASIRAIENAFGFTPTEQTGKLRLLLKHMETLQSHILHLYLLSMPDFLGTGSIFPLIDSSPEVVKRGLALKHLANSLCDHVGGRSIHPTKTVVGGFTMLPRKDRLSELHERLKGSLGDLMFTVELFGNFSISDFTRETEYVSLKGDGKYPFIGGSLVSSDGVLRQEHEYKEMTNEYMVDHSTSKWSRLSRKSFAVGALARMNNNFESLSPGARAIAEEFGMKPVNYNPFMNNIAQLVECVHVVTESIGIIEEYLDSTPGEPRQKVKPKEGSGVGAVEVPRGILYHAYDFDNNGRITSCDCVIPTSQNNANIHYDIQELALRYTKDHPGISDLDLEKLASMLVRAYDPCISCSVH